MKPRVEDGPHGCLIVVFGIGFIVLAAWGLLLLTGAIKP